MKNSPLFGLDGDDFVFPLSNNMAMDSDGDLMIRVGSNVALNLESGDLHMIMGWDDDEADL